MEKKNYTLKIISFITDVVDTAGKHSFVNISANFRKKLKYSGAWRKLINEKNLKLKISCQTPFKASHLSRTREGALEYCPWTNYSYLFVKDCLYHRWKKERIRNGYRQSHRVRLTVTVCILFCSRWECAFAHYSSGRLICDSPTDGWLKLFFVTEILVRPMSISAN
jgi:hypothetical protein